MAAGGGWERSRQMSEEAEEGEGCYATRRLDSKCKDEF